MFSPIAAVALCCAPFSPFAEPAGELGPAGPGLPGFDALPQLAPEAVAGQSATPEDAPVAAPAGPAFVGPPPGQFDDACGCGEPGSDPHAAPAPCGPDWLPIALRRALLIPQSVAGADFRPACARHDRTYAFGYREALGRLAAPGGRQELEAHVKVELEAFVKGELTDFAERELETFVQTELRSAIQGTTDGAADLNAVIDVEALIDLRSLWD